MKLKNILFTVFLLINLSFFAQKTTTSNSKKPASIYTQSNLLDRNSFSFINKKLKLNNLNFVFVNQIDLDLNQFSLQFNDIDKNTTAFIYGDYMAYRDENLLKGFLLKNDPTRWNLQCPNPLSAQSTE